MFPIQQYGEMVNEIPDHILSKKGSFNYFGSACSMMLTEKRRKQKGLTHSKEDTVAIENDLYFLNGAKKDAPDMNVDYNLIGYEKHIKEGLDKTVKWRLDNKPYNWPGQGNARLWDQIVIADNKHGILDWQGDILPTSLMRGNDLEKMRNHYFDDYGLYKVRPWSFNTFSEWGAKVATAGYYSEKGYKDDITVKTDISTYNYNFRHHRLIVTPDTVNEVDFIFNCYNSENYKWNQVTFKESFFNGKSKKIKNEKLFSFNKDKTFKYPIVIKLTNNGYELGYTSKIVDDSINFDKIVIPYQCSSYASGGTDIGNVVYVPSGIQLMSSYKWTKVEPSTASVHVNYLTSLTIKYLINEWRTSQTNDGHQLNVIPKLTNFTIKTNDDILELLGGKDIKEEIENGYKRKTKQK